MELDRIAAAEPPDHIEPIARRIVETVGMRTRVLEIGCGTGALARAMARRGAIVTAVDGAPRMIDIARSRTPGHLAIDYRVGDLARLSPRGFDVAIAIGPVRPLSLRDALVRMAAAVAPGGTLWWIGPFAARGFSSWLSRAQSDHDLLALAEIRHIAAQALPGAIVRRHLGARCSVRWSRPGV
jgi:SAM-dependent methyltransferase